ncbi:MAG TPA: hypothetical protein DEH78_25435 [Solibacterales bacterium]|nr:hypothetical protein [Bryobacterales bacterium]
MQCLYCGKRIAILRKLTQGEFCSDAHKRRYHQEQEQLGLARLIEAQQRLATDPPSPGSITYSNLAVYVQAAGQAGFFREVPSPCDARAASPRSVALERAFPEDDVCRPRLEVDRRAVTGRFRLCHAKADPNVTGQHPIPRVEPALLKLNVQFSPSPLRPIDERRREEQVFEGMGLHPPLAMPWGAAPAALAIYPADAEFVIAIRVRQPASRLVTVPEALPAHSLAVGYATRAGVRSAARPRPSSFAALASGIRPSAGSASHHRLAAPTPRLSRSLSLPAGFPARGGRSAQPTAAAVAPAPLALPLALVEPLVVLEALARVARRHLKLTSAISEDDLNARLDELSALAERSVARPPALLPPHPAASTAAVLAPGLSLFAPAASLLYPAGRAPGAPALGSAPVAALETMKARVLDGFLRLPAERAAGIARRAKLPFLAALPRGVVWSAVERLQALGRPDVTGVAGPARPRPHLGERPAPAPTPQGAGLLPALAALGIRAIRTASLLADRAIEPQRRLLAPAAAEPTAVRPPAPGVERPGAFGRPASMPATAGLQVVKRPAAAAVPAQARSVTVAHLAHAPASEIETSVPARFEVRTGPPAAERLLRLKGGRPECGVTARRGLFTPLDGPLPKPPLPRLRVGTKAPKLPGYNVIHRMRDLYWGIRENLPQVHFWRLAPVDLKWLALALPILIGLAITSRVWSPSAAKANVTGQEPIWARQVGAIRENIMRRAAVSLSEDFRSGLSDWEGNGDWAKSWSFDATGFATPGALALYGPSQSLSDYTLEFLATIDRRALSWVVRAADYKNYEAVKIAIVKPGPITQAALVHYSVVNGREQRPSQTPIPIALRPDTLYRVRTQVVGSDYAVSVQGQMVHSWTSSQFDRGGVGFFSGKGERSRIRWVEVSHQYDALGRLCAFLAPYSVQAKDGSWK